jgi:hypothetical protein
MRLHAVTKVTVVSRVSCGGRYLTLVNVPASETLPFLYRTLAELKRPYLHYRERVA